MTDPRDSTRKALFAYLDRSEKERIKSHPNKSNKKTNKTPEKDVERECTQWLTKNNFEGQVYESKAQLVNGSWRNAGMKFGTCDWQGVSPYGEAVFIEFKAKGKRSTFWKPGNERQTDYLVAKINSNAFAVVVDNVHDLERWFNCWRGARIGSLDLARKYLMGLLPPKPKRKVDESPLFDVD